MQKSSAEVISPIAVYSLINLHGHKIIITILNEYFLHAKAEIMSLQLHKHNILGYSIQKNTKSYVEDKVSIELIIELHNMMLNGATVFRNQTPDLRSK